MDEEKKDLIVTQKELSELDSITKNIMVYSEDDRRKADSLYEYYQKLIADGDKDGETRKALAKALALREESVTNLIEILKLKTKIVEKKIGYEMQRMQYANPDVPSNKRGNDTSDLIIAMETENEN